MLTAGDFDIVAKRLQKMHNEREMAAYVLFRVEIRPRAMRTRV